MTGPSRVVVTGRVPRPGLDILRRDGHRVEVWDSEDQQPREQLLEQVRGADALMTLLTEQVDAELLDAAGPQLKVVANVAVGYNNVDVDACRERGVVATNTPGVLTDATADIAMALILMTTRRLGEGERVIRSGTPWQWGMFYLLGTSLQHKTLGVVGLGAIGAATARRARAFGMNVIYTSRSSAARELETELGTHRVDMDTLLAQSDVVSLHCPYSSSTHHLLSTEQFAAMRPSAHVVNTARGAVIDEAALVEALREGEIAGAGLDVFEEEPAVHPGLLECDNAVLLPHLGSATIETRTAMATLAADNVAAVLAGREPPTPIG
ncbi:2-hydroxyacid dehydrogenase [Ornithinimicrobium flavum]|uniref:2-hydroxyacid dehydrogenase n=1 Tax=Ornithinimicrobium flavum TaxID=1288636 RepID=UPI00106FFAEA|nr:D-glycerate dehydrogenase [Ornithinimicrobium flavum]